MPTQRRFDIGASVVCEDGPAGELSRVVVDPVRQAITHLVVEPHDHPGLGRLVPVELVADVGEEIRLRCSRGRVRECEEAERVELLAEPDLWVTDVYAPATTVMVHEHLPAGEVAIRRGDRIHATDGTIGRVKGLVIDPERHDHITHVLLQEGHLWGKRRVSIPASAIARIDADGVHVSLDKHAIGELPEVEVRPVDPLRPR